MTHSFIKNKKGRTFRPFDYTRGDSEYIEGSELPQSEKATTYLVVASVLVPIFHGIWAKAEMSFCTSNMPSEKE